MNISLSWKRCQAGLLASAFVFLSLFPLNAAEKKKNYTDKELAGISAITARLFTLEHYNKKDLGSLSPVIYEDFLNNVDPMHMFLLQSDIDAFAAEKTSTAINLMKGDVSFAFRLHQKYVSRLKEYCNFAEEFLSRPVNIESDEMIEIDRTKAAWFKSKAEQQAFWRKKLTYDLESIMLNERAIAQDIAEKKELNPYDQETVIPGKQKKTPQQRLLSRIKMMTNSVQNREKIDILEFYLNAVAGVYDPHSSYMSPRSGEEFNIGMSLSLIGIGATLTLQDGYTKIVSLVPGGPASREGSLEKGDLIIAVAQKGEAPVDVVDMPLNEVVSMIRGKENTPVTLTVIKNGSGVTKLITIVRTKVDLQDSACKGEIREWNGKKYGVIDVPSFYHDYQGEKQGAKSVRSTTGDVIKILNDFKSKNLSGIIIDLRNNGGGSLAEAVTLTGLFIPEGPVVQVRNAAGKVETLEDEDGGKVLYDGPMAILINRYSASASEIFASAIQDYNRGIVIGDSSSHGKGSVQGIHDLSVFMPFILDYDLDAGLVKMTEAKFYRINGHSTQLKGVSSDIVLPSILDVMDVGEDHEKHFMPWDEIRSGKYNLYTGKYSISSFLRRMLAGKSKTRVSGNTEFARVRALMECYKVTKDRKSVTLNMEKRWNDYLEQKRILEEQERILDKSSPREKKGKKPDPYIQEAMNILQDMNDLISGSK